MTNKIYLVTVAITVKKLICDKTFQWNCFLAERSCVVIVTLTDYILMKGTENIAVTETMVKRLRIVQGGARTVNRNNT